MPKWFKSRLYGEREREKGWFCFENYAGRKRETKERYAAV